MDLLPEPRVDNGLVLPGIGLAFVDGFTAIDAIVQQAIQVALIDQRALFAAVAGELCWYPALRNRGSLALLR